MTILLKFYSIFLVQYIYIHNATPLKCQLADIPHIMGFTQSIFIVNIKITIILTRIIKDNTPIYLIYSFL